MPRIESDLRTTPSVLDRLIDLEPGLSSEPPASRQKSLRQLKDSVRRDLEWLLNSRQLVDEIPADLKETRHSLAAYGLPDFTGAGVSNPAEKNSMRRLIEDAIETFEPRLRDVAVSVEAGKEFERSLHFRIVAYLQVEPAPELVTFDTVLQPLSTEFKVQEEK
jgi:type VI secretion system protein ImpF